MKKYDLIIFDCDGTLIDSETFNNNVTSGLLLELGLEEYTREACLNFFQGRSWNEMKVMLKEKHGDIIPDNIVEQYIERVHDGIPDHVEAVKGAEDILATLSKTHKICVASNGERRNVCTELQATGIDQYFGDDKTFTKSQVENPKPAPDLFLFAAAQMNVSLEKCLVIEDSLTGVKAGIAAGMDVIGFTGTSHEPKKLKESMKKEGVSAVIGDLIHMADFVNP